MKEFRSKNLGFRIYHPGTGQFCPEFWLLTSSF